MEAIEKKSVFDENSTVSQILNTPEFAGYAHLLFPVDRYVDPDWSLKQVTSENVYIWYSNFHVSDSVRVLNTLLEQERNQIRSFYPIYTKEQMQKDPSKRNTGLFFFRGKPDKEFALVSAGGGFMYVGALHDSFPQALEISKNGYNAFALIYRPDHPYEDLAAALHFIYEHAKELKVDPKNYSLWGGSAGGRMSAALSNKQIGPGYFGYPDIPMAAAAIVQYTGYNQVSKSDAPTFSNVGTNDGIASWQGMEHRLKALKRFGIDTQFEVYKGLRHGFGIGTGTAAQGWVERALKFWQKQIDQKKV